MKRSRTDGWTRNCRFAAALALSFLALSIEAPAVGRAEPQLATQIFPSATFQRVGDFIRGEIAAGHMPGAVILVQQHGHPIYFECFGVRDVENRRPMTPDSIFRLYSMSKPITSVAAMMLVEEGKLALDDPVAKYIPAFAGVKVATEKTDESGKPVLAVEPLRRPITIEDLLRHTSGLTTASMAIRRCASSMRIPICSMAISTTRSSSSGSQNCRWPNSRERDGIMAIRPMCSAVSSR